MAKLEIAVQRVTKSRITEVDFGNLPFGAIFSDHMLLADYAKGKWDEPRIVPYGPMSMTPAASALHYGQAIFEGFKAFRQRDGGVVIFRIADNMARMQRSAARMAMPELDTQAFTDGIVELVRQDREWVPRTPDGALYIRPVYFATEEALWVHVSANYRLAVVTCPVGAYFKEPVRLLAEQKYVRAFPGGTGSTKAAGNYGASMLATREAQKNGFHNVLWLDAMEHLYAEESGAANIFFVIGGVVVTPPLAGTILEGVTRDSLLTLLRDMGVPVAERRVAITELVEASKKGETLEAFAVGTAATVAPVASIRYRDFDIRMSLDPKTSVASRVRAKLDAIRYGDEPDRHGWLLRV